MYIYTYMYTQIIHNIGSKHEAQPRNINSMVSCLNMNCTNLLYYTVTV